PVNDQGDVKRSFEGRFVKRGKSAARVRGFKLGDRVVTELGLGQIEAAQLVVQCAGELDVDACRSRFERAGDSQGDLLLVRNKRGLRRLRLFALRDGGVLDLNFR